MGNGLPQAGRIGMHRLTLFKKLLLAMLLISLVPLFISSVILFVNLRTTSHELAERIAASVDLQASENLEMRARQIAANVAAYLKDCEADLRLAASLSESPESLAAFYASRNDEIWYRSGTASSPHEVRETIPRYWSLEIVDRTGEQRFVIRHGRRLAPAELANVADPANTEFKSERYFADTIGLKRGEIQVSHLTGFHVGKAEQLGSATEPELAAGGKEYRGVIRFSTPLYSRNGALRGIMVLSLDHRHLMEFSQHVLPGKVGETVFPSYRSGNYAFMFDDEGWMITHPKFWDIRGVDAAGRQVPPYTASSGKEDIAAGRIPYNLDHAGFIHPNYPVAARQVREHKSGYVDVTNVGGAKKVMAFAPIPYTTGPYRRYGIFGGVTIGFQADLFHEPARAAVEIIDSQLKGHVGESVLILFATALLTLGAAWLLSRSITRPLALLTRQARMLAEGGHGTRVQVAAQDELGELASDFNRMADELERRNSSLMDTLSELEHSRQQIIEERNFKESILGSISSAILSFSPSGILLSVNRYGMELLAPHASPGIFFGDLFREWEPVAKRLATVLETRSGYGRTPLILTDQGRRRHFDIGMFPIGSGAAQGVTVTIREETEKERMREEMTRMDRFASLGKLSAGIAHEVRNPLTGITLLLDDLHDRPGLDPDTQSMVGKALAEIERVERLISSLLTYASPARARFATADLNLAVQDSVILFRRACEKQGVELSCSPGPLPPFSFDVDQVKQVLLNLIANALDAVPAGGRIVIATARKERHAVITVADTGPGIPADDIPLLFEPFFSRKSAGTGLGLSIAQRIIEDHHGTIDVTSVPGEGTLFTISLPLDGEDLPATGERPRTEHGKDPDH